MKALDWDPLGSVTVIQARLALYSEDGSVAMVKQLSVRGIGSEDPRAQMSLVTCPWV